MAPALVPWLVIAPLGLTLVATTAALALRRPRLRPLAFVSAGGLTLAGCWLLLLWLLHGGHALETMLPMASPMVLGLSLITTLWLDARERAARS